MCGASVPAALKCLPGANLSRLPRISPDERETVVTAQYRMILDAIYKARRDPSFRSPILPFDFPADYDHLPRRLQDLEDSLGAGADGPRKKAKLDDARIEGRDVVKPPLALQDLFEAVLKRNGRARRGSDSEPPDEEETA